MRGSGNNLAKKILKASGGFGEDTSIVFFEVTNMDVEGKPLLATGCLCSANGDNFAPIFAKKTEEGDIICVFRTEKRQRLLEESYECSAAEKKTKL